MPGQFRPRVQWNELLLGLAVLVPALLFFAASWFNRFDVMTDGELSVQRVAAIMQENAGNTFDTADLVLDRVQDHIDGKSDAAISDPQMSSFLRRLKAPIDQIVSIWVTDKDGRILAGTSDWNPQDSVKDRDFFKAQEDQDSGSFISKAFVGKATKTPSFAISRRRNSADKSFVGTVHVSLSPDYSSRFYAEAASTLAHDAMLMRVDGQVLASDPPRDSLAVAQDDPLMQAIKAAPELGIVSIARPADDDVGIYAYRKVEDEPVYVVYGTTQSTILLRWFRNIKIYGIGAGVAALTLLGVTILALRRARAERHALERLANESGQRLAAEQQLRQALKMDSIGQLTGGIAHDFNNLLSVILGCLTLLRKTPKDEARTKMLIDGAIEGAERGVTLTKRLLAFARRQDLDPGQVELAALATGMAGLIGHLLPAGHKLSIDVPATLPKVFIDSNQLELALLNLVLNARDAMPDGGDIVIKGFEQSLDLSNSLGLKPDRYVCISVRDHGIGMNEETLARAVEPFFTTKGIGKGTGLGLSMIHGFAIQSGGRLRLTSAPGMGTVAELWLPISRSEAAAQPRTELPASPERRVKILIVDDDVLVRNALCAMLEDLGHTVLVAASALQALQRLESEPSIEIVLTDYAMPIVDGVELANRIRIRWPNLPVMLMSGNLKPARSGLEDFAYLLKPFSQEQLQASLARLLLDAKTPHADHAHNSRAQPQNETIL